MGLELGFRKNADFIFHDVFKNAVCLGNNFVVTIVTPRTTRRTTKTSCKSGNGFIRSFT